MKYNKNITIKDGRKCLLRNGTSGDGKTVLECFNKCHRETDFLLTYPDENTFTAELEAEYLQSKTDSGNEIEIISVVDGVVAGTAGIDSIGGKEKIKHRAEFGISVLKEYWGLGIGRALTDACIECAREAGYLQLELDVVADNKNAVALYESVGFVEYGRNPLGFRSRISGMQELILMRLDLK